MCANTRVYGTCRPPGLRRTGGSLSNVRAPFVLRKWPSEGRSFKELAAPLYD